MVPYLRTAALAFLAGLTLVSPALAAPKPKPDFAVKTKAIDGTVTFDAIIKAEPKLAVMRVLPKVC